MKASDFNKHGGEIIMARLNDEKTDPRKIMAFLGSEHGDPLMSAIGSRFDVILQRIALYSKQHPQNREMNETVERIKLRLNSLKS
ncbi:MAG: hypothetical protein ACREX0_08580 [Noviherbaspirillum sp.]